MAWTYLDYDENGDQVERVEMPPQGSIFLVFDELRWRLMVGYLERHRYVLDPDVNGDCVWLAWAPLDEVEIIDMGRLLASGCIPGKQPGAREYRGEGPKLMLNGPSCVQGDSPEVIESGDDVGPVSPTSPDEQLNPKRS